MTMAQEQSVWDLLLCFLEALLVSLLRLTYRSMQILEELFHHPYFGSASIHNRESSGTAFLQPPTSMQFPHRTIDHFSSAHSL